ALRVATSGIGPPGQDMPFGIQLATRMEPIVRGERQVWAPRDDRRSRATPRNLSASVVLAYASASFRRLKVRVTTRPPIRVRPSYCTVLPSPRVRLTIWAICPQHQR